MREIGERAAVDALALIARYFDSKEGLYLATLRQEGRPEMPTDPYRPSRGDADRVRAVGDRAPFRWPGQPGTRPMAFATRSFHRADHRPRVVEPLAARLAVRDTPDAQLRVEVLVAMALGLSLTRAGGTLPVLAETPLDRTCSPCSSR